MKLFEIILKVKERAENISEREITNMVNSLQLRLSANIFAPCGIKVDSDALDPKTDMEKELLLGPEFADLYFYYIMAIISANEADSTAYDNYFTLFNCAYSELAVQFRRNNCPIKGAKIGGRNI